MTATEKLRSKLITNRKFQLLLVQFLRAGHRDWSTVDLARKQGSAAEGTRKVVSGFRRLAREMNL